MIELSSVITIGIYSWFMLVWFSFVIKAIIADRIIKLHPKILKIFGITPTIVISIKNPNNI